jgi:hypothetical protein
MTDRTAKPLSEAVITAKGTDFSIVAVGEMDNETCTVLVNFAGDKADRLFMIDVLNDVRGGAIIPFSHKVSEMTQDELKIFVIGNSVKDLKKTFDGSGGIDFSGVELIVEDSPSNRPVEKRSIEKILKDGRIFLGLEDYNVRNELFEDENGNQAFDDETEYKPTVKKIADGYYVEVVE